MTNKKNNELKVSPRSLSHRLVGLTFNRPNKVLFGLWPRQTSDRYGVLLGLAAEPGGSFRDSFLRGLLHPPIKKSAINYNLNFESNDIKTVI